MTCGKLHVCDLPKCDNVCQRSLRGCAYEQPRTLWCDRPDTPRGAGDEPARSVAARRTFNADLDRN